MSDEILFERFRNEGNRDALFLLFRKHQLPLYRFLSGFVGDHATAEDVVQETFLRAIRGARGYRRTTTFKAWLYRIAVNTARNVRRDEQRRMRREETASLLFREKAMTETNLPGHDDVRAIVHREVNNLPDDLRAALALRYFSEATYEEIADFLDIPPGTVSWRIHEGLTRLQKRFAGLGLAAVVPLLEQHLAVMARHILVSAELELKVAKIVATARVLESGGTFSSKPPVKTNVPAGVLGIAGAVIVFLLGAGMFFLLFDNPVPSQRIERGDQKAGRSPGDVGKNDRLFPVNSRAGSSTASGAKNAQSAEGPAVAGVVGDEDGQPVGDAILRLYPVSLIDDGGDSYGFGFDGNEVAHTISQPTGEYQFTAVAFKQAYEIVAQKEGYLPTIKIFYIDEQKNRRVDIIVRKGCRVTGRVVNRKGDPCPDAVVAQGTYDAPEPNRLAKTNMEEISTICRRASNTTGRFFHRYRQSITLTDKDGRYAFIAAVGPFGVRLVETEMSTLQHGGAISIFRHPPENIFVRTSKESLYRFLGMRQEMSGELVGVEDYYTLSVNGDCSIPDIVVAKGLFLEGRVVDHHGEPVAGATVGAIGGGIKKVGWEVTGDGSKVQEIRRFPEYGRAVSDKRGHFMIGGLLPGRYYLKASHGGKDSAGYQVVDLVDDQSDIPIRIHLGVTLAGKITDDEGKILEGCIPSVVATPLGDWSEDLVDRRLPIAGEEEESFVGGVKSALWDGGRFEFPHLNKGRYRLTVENLPSFYTEPEPLEIDLQTDCRDVEIRLKRGWRISGTIMFTKTVVSHSMEVRLKFISPRRGEKILRCAAWDEATAMMNFESPFLPPGSYTIVAEANWLDSTTSREVTITDRDVDGIVLAFHEEGASPLFSIRGEVRGPNGEIVPLGKDLCVLLKKGVEIVGRYPPRARPEDFVSLSPCKFFEFVGVRPGIYTLEVQFFSGAPYARCASSEIALRSDLAGVVLNVE